MAVQERLAKLLIIVFSNFPLRWFYLLRNIEYNHDQHHGWSHQNFSNSTVFKINLKLVYNWSRQRLLGRPMFIVPVGVYWISFFLGK
jgi:hypothetical protein